MKFSGNVHYSGFVFSNIVMKGGDIIKRHKKDGQIRISLLYSHIRTSCRPMNRSFIISYIILVSY